MSLFSRRIDIEVHHKSVLFQKNCILEKAANVGRLCISAFWQQLRHLFFLIVWVLFCFFVVVVFTLLTWQILTWSREALISSCAPRCVKKLLFDRHFCLPFPFCCWHQICKCAFPRHSVWLHASDYPPFLVLRRQQSRSHEHQESYVPAAMSRSFFFLTSMYY